MLRLLILLLKKNFHNIYLIELMKILLSSMMVSILHLPIYHISVLIKLSSRNLNKYYETRCLKASLINCLKIDFL